MSEQTDIPAHRHAVNLRSGDTVVIDDAAEETPLAGTGLAIQLPGAIGANGKLIPPVRRGLSDTPPA